MTDIFNVNGMTTAGNTVVKTVINGKGHSITNIYVFPNCAIFGSITGMANTSGAAGYNVFELNDIIFEAILQKGAGFFSHSGRQNGPDLPRYKRHLVPLTNGCIFNVKVDNSLDNRYGDTLFAFNYHQLCTYNDKSMYPKAVNCIFNIYISAATNDYNCLFSVNANSSTDFSLMTIFESCEFRIRNNTDKLISIFKNYCTDGCRFLVDNCSFFLADIKQYDNPNKRTTSFGEVGYNGTMHVFGFWRDFSYIFYPKCAFYNSFVAAFGDDFNSGSNDPIYIYGEFPNTNKFEFATSFYDKSKIRFCNSGSGDTPLETDGFAALTTEQCKDKRVLSNIGYLFAEEV